MATLLVHEVLDLVKKQSKKEDKIKVLRQNESWALKDIIRASMDSKIQFHLPKGDPPHYTPCDIHNAPSNLLRENKKLTYFVKGGQGDKLPQFKREKIFIGMLEGVHPDDAKLLIDMINKKTPTGLTRPLVKEAFPGLLQDD